MKTALLFSAALCGASALWAQESQQPNVPVVKVIPGGDPAPLKNGDVIADTQGSIDLMGMVGQFINKSGSPGGGSASPSTPAATP